MSKDFLTMDDFDFDGKTVILRVDINSPFNEKTQKIEESPRLAEHAKTIRELSDKNAKVIILAHQGRRGGSDFINLEQHAKILSKYVGREVDFIDDIDGKNVLYKISIMDYRDIILLDNVRSLSYETKEKNPKEHSKSQLVQTLAPHVDIFVNDAFSAAHRSHASMVGFTRVLPSCAGRLMERELKSLKNILDKPKHPFIFVVGGAKPDEPLGLLKNFLRKKKLDKVLTSGVIGNLFLISKGYALGKETMYFLEKKDYLKYLPEVRKITKRYGKMIEIPSDLAIEYYGRRREISIEKFPRDEMIMDIGKETIDSYSKILKKAKTVLMKGTPGVYEDDKFAYGTRMLLESVSKCKYSFVGGGHITSALTEFRFDKKKFTHVSLGGGVLVTYLSGKSLPAVNALKTAVKKKRI